MINESIENDLVVSEDWSPKVGGAHYWLENTYKRWGSLVSVATSTTESTERLVADSGGGLKIYRNLKPIKTISLNPTTWYPVLTNALKVLRIADGKTIRIHCRAYFPEGLVGLVAKKLSGRSIKLVVYVHGEELNVARTSGLLYIVAKRVFSCADLIIANSKNTEKLLKNINSTSQVEVIHPGVDAKKINEYLGQRQGIRKEYGWLPQDFVVLTVARLEPRKNIPLTIDALVKIRQMGHNVSYVIVGQGDGNFELSQKIEAVGGREWITHIPKLTEVEKNKIFCAADLFVLPSIKSGPMIEGFGIVFLEAAAAGLPAISGISGGEPEAVIDRVTGVNVDGSDKNELVRAILEMIEDDQLRARFSDAAKLWAAENDWDLVSESTKTALNFGAHK